MQHCKGHTCDTFEVYFLVRVSSRMGAESEDDMDETFGNRAQTVSHLHDYISRQHLVAEDQKELAVRLLRSLPFAAIHSTALELQAFLKRDFLALLPVELALNVLKYLDVQALGRLEQVSSKHVELIRAQASVWRTLFWQQPGWAADLDLHEIQDTLAVSVEDLAPRGTVRRTATDDLAYGTLPRQLNFVRNSRLLSDDERLEQALEQQQQQSSISSAEDTSNPASFSMDPDTSFLPLDHTLLSVNPHSGSHFMETDDGLITNHPQSMRSGGERRHSRERRLNSQENTYEEPQDDDDQKTIDWRRLYRSRLHLERNWRTRSYAQTEFQGHSEAIYCLQFDADKIMTGSRDDTVKIWDLRTKACIQSLRGHDASVLCLQYDSEFLVTGSSDSTIIVWSLLTGTLQKRLWGHSESVLGLRFTRKRIVSCSKDTTIKVWDFGSGDLLQTLVGHRAAVNAVQCHGNLIVSASGDRSIKIWNLESGELLRTIVGHSRGIACIQFNGSLIVSGSSDQTIRIWDVHSGKLLKTLSGHTELVRTLQFNEAKIVSGSYDGTIRVWDMPSGQCLFSLMHETRSRVFKVQFSASKIVACLQGGQVLIHDFAHDVLHSRCFEASVI